MYSFKEAAKFAGKAQTLKRVKMETESTFDHSYVYKWNTPIGVGWQGTVRLCQDKRSGKLMACKTVNLSECNSAHLRQEVAMHQKCSSHPFVVTLHEAFETDQEMRIVMEYCKGGTLTELINEYPDGLRLDLAQHLMKQLAQVMAYIHRDKGVIHRDIKTENILLSDDKTSIRLTDFGMATEIQPQEEHGRLDGVMRYCCGTPGYIAPEVLRCEAARPANDIWSLGVVLFLMLTGDWPFDLDKLDEEIATIDCSGDIEFWNKNLPKDAMHLVLRMLDFNPETRICATEILEHPWLTQVSR